MPRVRYDMVGCWVLRHTPGGWEHLQLRRAPDDYMGGVWSLCRGRAEGDETAVQAALRELREETTLTPLEFYRLGTLEQFYMSDNDTIWHVPFFAAVVAPDATVTLNPEHDAHRWVPDAQIDAALTWPSELRILEELRRFIFTDHPTKALMRLSV